MTLTIERAHRSLSITEKRELADALGDSPETALPVHVLRKGHGKVWLTGEVRDLQAVIIEEYDVGPELMAFGADPGGLWWLLRGIHGWDAVNVPQAVARELADLMKPEIDAPMRLVDDIYQVPGGPVAVIPHPDVRLLTIADCAALDTTPDELRDSFEDDLEMVLAEELVAGAFADGKIVAIASTYGFCEPFVDVAVSTLAGYRGRGYARAGASLVAGAVQQAGRVPIWSCAPTNTASLAVAASLGFRECGRRVNIVLDEAGE